MNDYKLYVNSVDVTKYAGEIEWSDNEDSISAEFGFKLANYKASVGSRFQLKNNGIEVIRGIITDENYSNNTKIFGYSGFDYGFFLNKNEVIIQFNGVAAGQAIRQLLGSVNIPFASISDISVKITEKYKDKVVSDVIKDILEKVYKRTGKKYRIESYSGKVSIIENKPLEVTAYYQLSSDTARFEVQKSISNFQASNSIQEMKNKIIVTSNDEKSGKIFGIESDQANINKYGLMQQIETVDKDDPLKNQIARTLLKELNKIKQTRSVEMLGADEIKAGRLLSFNYPDFDFVGLYEVKSCKHKIFANHHKVNLELEAYEG